MARVSDDAIERDRIASRERYHRNKAQYRKTQNAYNADYRERKFEERPFIGWDSEGYDFFVCHPDGTVETGPQRTMLFGCSIPGRYIIPTDARPWLSTMEMLDLILEVEKDYPDAFHVGFVFEYDINQILRDLSWSALNRLKDAGVVHWHGYRIKHIPHKLIAVSKDGISATIFDCFGFFHSKYTTALEKFNVGTPELRARIARGKDGRGQFTWADIDEVVDYMQAELSLLPPLMECIRDAANGGGFRIHQWHGPGAFASWALRHHNVRDYMSTNNPAPGYVQQAIALAYAGGRFQAWRCGEYEGPIYTLDKNSAYVHAIAQLPNLSRGSWSRVDPNRIKSESDIARFGLYHIVYDNGPVTKQQRSRGLPERPYPLFHRAKNGQLTWPRCVDGWYWSPEARLVAGDPHAKFVEAFVFDDDGTYPLNWVEGYYKERVRLQRAGNPAEKAYKWTLAAMYGSFARRVGWDKKTRTAPRSHELAWAGFITSHCRADIYKVAVYAARKGALISVDTDGVMSMVPFPETLVDTGFGDGLGQWKQDEFSALLYWQNGIYWLREKDGNNWVEAKTRGVPKGVIPLERAQKALADGSFIPPFRNPVIRDERARYVGYRQGLQQQFRRWRVWDRQPMKITFGGTGKGVHTFGCCVVCLNGYTGNAMHVINHVTPFDPISTPHKLPWKEDIAEDTAVGTVISRDFIDSETDIYSDGDMDDRL